MDFIVQRPRLAFAAASRLLWGPDGEAKKPMYGGLTSDGLRDDWGHLAVASDRWSSMSSLRVPSSVPGRRRSPVVLRRLKRKFGLVQGPSPILINRSHTSAIGRLTGTTPHIELFLDRILRLHSQDKISPSSLRLYPKACDCDCTCHSD